MYRAPYSTNPVGHIRIVDDVQSQAGGVIFHTSEARGDGVTGPTARWWRYQDASQFSKLEEFVDDDWQPAEAREQPDTYSRRLPASEPFQL